MPVTTVTTTTSSSTIVGSARALTQPLGLLCLLQLVSTCVAFLLVASVGAWTGSMGNWAIFTWCFCFAVTLIILIVGRWTPGLLPSVMAELPHHLCLLRSPLLPVIFHHLSHHLCAVPTSRTFRDHAIAVTTFSCVACLAYGTEVAWNRARPGEITGYMATVPGLLKVFETFVAYVIFAFISKPALYQEKPALEWCVAVYAICFILAGVTIMLNLGDCTNMLPIPFSTFLSGLALLSVLFYATAIVLWPLYQFDQRYHVYPHCSMDPSCTYTFLQPHTVCFWDR